MLKIVGSHVRANVVGYLALFIALGGTALAATGDPFILGKPNSASSKTSLSAPIHNKTLQLTNTSTDIAATALGLNVAANHPPFTVNSGTKVANLNADKLDGIDSTGFLHTGDEAGGDLNGPFSNLQMNAGAVGTDEFSSSIPAARVTRSGAQTILNNTHTALAFDSERYDTAAMHDNVTNNSRLTAPVTGIYLVTAQVHWATQTAGVRRIAIMRNTFTPIAIDGYKDPSSFGSSPQEITTQTRLTAGQDVEVHVYQNSGGSLNVLSDAEYTPELSMTWLAPG